ncbi:helix-turn-helix transcriptional regulator [Ferrovibrio sp.]|uniref:AraC family transcriptional regulator n=1 Tax=Ferrovibrio sp. TaxID=1917215 RepID=UPI0035B0A420
MENGILSTSLSPGIVPEDEHLALWRQSVAPYFDVQPVHQSRPGDPLPEIHQYHLGRAILAESKFAAQSFRRDRQWMARYDDVDHVLFQLLCEGSNHVVNGKANFVQKWGNVYAVNMAYELDAQSADARAITFVLPRPLLREELPYLTDIRGNFLPDGSAAARIFSSYLASLRETLSTARADEADAIVQVTLGLMDSLALHGDIASSAAEGVSFVVICRYIEKHLSDFDLGPDKICRHFRCSRSTIYRLFKQQGGLWSHIQRRRLVACFQALISPHTRHRRIFDIALDYGFASPSQFSRLFREHFGVTPRQARDAGLARPAGIAPPPQIGNSAQSAAELMSRWATTLIWQTRGSGEAIGSK